jgi:hypothetical protein
LSQRDDGGGWVMVRIECPFARHAPGKYQQKIIKIAMCYDADQWVSGPDRIAPTGALLPVVGQNTQSTGNCPLWVVVSTDRCNTYREQNR